MSLLKNISKISYTFIILCFFLPFIPEGCEEKGKPITEADTTSISETSDIQNYTPVDTSSIDDNSIFVESDTLIPVKKTTGPSLFERFIKPDNENLSGLGFIISYYPFILKLSSVPAALFIAILCLYRRSAERFFNEMSTLIYTSIGLLSLLILLFITNVCDLKVGYWLALIFYIIATISDLKIYWDWKNQERKFYDNNY